MSADYQATEKLNLNASIVYNTAEDDFSWTFSERTQLLDMNGNVLAENGVEAPGMLGSVNYDDYTANNLIDGYSDLEFEQYSFTLGGTYNFTEAFYTTASFTYDIFEADEEYVYGDEDGDALSGYVAIGYKF